MYLARRKIEARFFPMEKNLQILCILSGVLSSGEPIVFLIGHNQNSKERCLYIDSYISFVQIYCQHFSLGVYFDILGYIMSALILIYLAKKNLVCKNKSSGVFFKMYIHMYFVPKNIYDYCLRYIHKKFVLRCTSTSCTQCLRYPSVAQSIW